MGYKLWKLSTSEGGNTHDFKLKAYFFQNLCNRTKLIDLLAINKTYTLKQVMHLAEMDEFTALMAVGNLIKTGVMTFDKKNGKDWNEMNQEYILKKMYGTWETSWI